MRNSHQYHKLRIIRLWTAIKSLSRQLKESEQFPEICSNCICFDGKIYKMGLIPTNRFELLCQNPDTGEGSEMETSRLSLPLKEKKQVLSQGGWEWLSVRRRNDCVGLTP